MRPAPIVALLMTLTSTPVGAEMLADASLLEAMAAAEWPVVDGRDLVDRSQQPIEGAQPFDAELRLDGPHVLVVTDGDEAALTLARVVEARFPGVTAIAVSGGAATLLGVRRVAAAAFVDGLPLNFTIPRDTCATDDPLHVFKGTEESQP